MIAYANKDLFRTQSHDKTFTLSGTGFNIQNGAIRSEEVELEEVLNKENYLNFGECNSHKLSVTVGYYEKSIAGLEATAKITPTGGADLPYGTFKVYSDFPTADKKFRQIVMFDKLADIQKMDVTEWYNTQLPDANTTKTIKQLRDSLAAYVGITQETVTLPNDDVTVTRTVEPSNMTGKTALFCICQANGCFGRIGRNGNLQYVFLPVPAEGLFPADDLYPSDDLYPEEYGFESNEQFENGTYIECKYEEYLTDVIDSVVIMNAENVAAGSAGTGTNAFILRDNFLLFGKTAADLNQIAANILNVVGGLWFRPAQIEAVAEPWMETGDGIRVHTVDGVDVDTYILSRKIKGIQALFDSISSDCLQLRPNDGNTTSEQINKLKGNEKRIEADLIEAKRIIADEIQADRAQIQDLYTTKATIQELNAVDAKIDNLTAIAITTQNLSAQEISASQITTGTLDASRITVNNLSADSINSGTMSVERISDIYGGSAQSRWYEITYVSSGSLTDWVSVRNGANTGTVQVPTGLSLNSHRLYVLKGSPLDP